MSDNPGTGLLASLWRIVLVLWGLVLLALTAGFAVQEPMVTDLWPWPDGALSYLFVGSIMAATGVPIIWIGLSGELAAQRAGALDFALTYAGIVLTFWFLYPAWVDEYFTVILVAGDALLLNLVIYLFCRPLRFRDQRPSPGLVRWSFLLFCFVLIGVGGSLVIQVPFIFPWPLKAQTSVLFGWIFLGAAVYFLHGFIFPYWANARGQLLGFLAYDAVLAWPFYQHIMNVKEEHWLSLLIYLAVIVYSFLLAFYFLFLHPSTRFGSEALTDT